MELLFPSRYCARCQAFIFNFHCWKKKKGKEFLSIFQMKENSSHPVSSKIKSNNWCVQNPWELLLAIIVNCSSVGSFSALGIWQQNFTEVLGYHILICKYNSLNFPYFPLKAVIKVCEHFTLSSGSMTDWGNSSFPEFMPKQSFTFIAVK